MLISDIAYAVATSGPDKCDGTEDFWCMDLTGLEEILVFLGASVVAGLGANIWGAGAIAHVVRSRKLERLRMRESSVQFEGFKFSSHHGESLVAAAAFSF
ncbi:MAG: hypothetical protein JXX14_25085 [Deltaproteobacteria bacterium]|nr:hypothetical protein [Deltaproteobacteria bacterium]